MPDTQSEFETNGPALQPNVADSRPVDGNSESMESSGKGQFRHLSPNGQPESVHEISDALYRPFQIEAAAESKVRLHIAGCHIDLVPFLRTESGKYFLLNGTQVSDQHAESLGLDDLQERKQLPHQWTSKFERQKTVSEIALLGNKVELATAADGRQWLVWCSHVHGVLVAETDESSVSVPFSLWGARLKKGLEKCPPYHCPLEKIPTYSLDADDEGTISDSNSILVCPESGRRLLMSKMGTCMVSGKQLDPSHLVRCPINNNMVNKKLLVVCKGCFQSTAPNAIQRGRCQGCRQLTRLILGTNVTAPNPLHDALKHIQTKHPALTAMKKIKMAEQVGEWLIQAKIGRFAWIILVDKQTLEFKRVSRSTGWLKPWASVDQSEWPE